MHLLKRSSHVDENLRKKKIPSDHAAARLVIQKPTHRRHQSKRFPNWISKHPIFGSILQHLHDDHRFSSDPSCALSEFKILLQKVKKMTIREAETDFGQSDFGHPYWPDFGQFRLWPNQLWPTFNWPTLAKPAQGGVQKGRAPKGWGPERVALPKCHAFSSLPGTVSLFLCLSGGSSRGILVVF